MYSQYIYRLNSKLELVVHDTFEDEVYISDTLVMPSGKDKYRSWSYFVQKADSSKLYKTHYISGIIDSKSYPAISKGTLLEPSNLGKSNERSSFDRCVVLGESKFKTQLRMGYTTVSSVNTEITYDLINRDINFAPIPEQYKPSSEDIKPPYWASVKYDGASLICCYHPAFTNHTQSILVYTRNRKVCAGFDDIREALYPILKKHRGLFIVGEIYDHGLTRNAINSIHSQNLHGSLTTLSEGMKYYLFDCFYALNTKVEVPKLETSSSELLEMYNDVVVSHNEALLKGEQVSDECLKKYEKVLDISNKSLHEVAEYFNNNEPLDLLYSQRQLILKGLVKECANPLIQLAVSKLITNKEELTMFYEDVLKHDYEGLVVRKDTTYMFSFRKKKINPQCFKLKPFTDEEFKIVGYKTGMGKHDETITFLCDISHLTGTSVTLKVPMNMDEKEMSELYQDVKSNFEAKYKGKMLTVKYEKLSDKGVPLFPKGITIRDDLD